MMHSPGGGCRQKERSMIRLTLKMSLLAFFFAVLPPQPGVGFGPAPAAADLMQCMTSCIKHEGGNSAAKTKEST